MCFGRIAFAGLHSVFRSFGPVECDEALILFDRNDGEHGGSVAFDGDRAFGCKRKAFTDLGGCAGKGDRAHGRVISLGGNRN